MNTERLKLYAVIGVLILCAAWLGWHLLVASRGYGVAKPLDTPAWRIAKDLNVKIAAETRFNDVGFSVVSEKPMKFLVSGAVHSAALLEALKERIKQEDPDHEFEYDVLVPPR
jgi:hypothetical protein